MIGGQLSKSNSAVAQTSDVVKRYLGRMSARDEPAEA